MTSHEIFLEHEALEKRFCDFFQAKGLVIWPEEPLIPRADPTLLFSNATIVSLKPILLGRTELPSKGVMVKQTCLRTQNLQSILDAQVRIHYLSLFNMLGVLVGPHQGESLLEAAVEFFLRIESISRGRILIRYSAENNFFLPWCHSLKKWAISFEQDSRAQNYYRWTYGISGVRGSGVTFALRQNDGSFLDIGNLIEIRSGEQVLGFEFGFGVETFLARKFSLGSPILASLINTPLSDGGTDDEKLRDCLASSLAMIRANVIPGSGRQSSILRKSLRSAIFLAKRMGVSLDQLTIWIRDYLSIHSHLNDKVDLLITKYLEKYEANTAMEAV